MKDITLEDIKFFKEQLDNEDIPKREYIGWFILNEEQTKEFIKDFGERLLQMSATNYMSFMRKSIIQSDLTLEEKLDKWGIEVLKKLFKEKIDFSMGNDETDLGELYEEFINED